MSNTEITHRAILVFFLIRLATVQSCTEVCDIEKTSTGQAVICNLHTFQVNPSLQKTKSFVLINCINIVLQHQRN